VSGHQAPPGSGAADGDRDAEPTGPELPDVAAVILAAGSGRRFGDGTKQVAEVEGRPLVAHVVETAWGAGVARVLVVVGHDADAVVAAASLGGDIEVVHNPDHADGQATSLRTGLEALADDASTTTAVVLLADQPAVRATAILAVANAVAPRQGAGPVCARASYRDGPGHPVAFARAAWDTVRERTDGDEGARGILELLGAVPVLVAGDVPRDVDAPDDLDAVAEQLAKVRRATEGAAEDA
jgi:molybdenum cofactor cytidylyltransferase